MKHLDAAGRIGLQPLCPALAWNPRACLKLLHECEHQHALPGLTSDICAAGDKVFHARANVLGASGEDA